MIPFKVKIDKTVSQQRVEIKTRYGKGFALRLQAFRYDSTNPGLFLHLLDADGDEFMFPIPGQGTPKASTLEIPLTLSLPLFYYDDGEHELILWGEVEKIEKFETNF